MSRKPIIPQPRPVRPASNAAWTVPLLVFEFVVLFALLVSLVACNDGIECRRWTVKEEVIMVQPFVVGPVKRCAEWFVKDVPRTESPPL